MSYLNGCHVGPSGLDISIAPLLKTKTGHPTGCPVSFQLTQKLRLAHHRHHGRRGRVGHHVVFVFAGISSGVEGLADAAEVDKLGVEGVAGQDAGIGGAAPGGFGGLLLTQPLQKLGGRSSQCIQHDQQRTS